jgi:hypothetical protein
MGVARLVQKVYPEATPEIFVGLVSGYAEQHGRPFVPFKDDCDTLVVEGGDLHGSISLHDVLLGLPCSFLAS